MKIRIINLNIEIWNKTIKDSIKFNKFLNLVAVDLKNQTKYIFML